MAVSRCAAMRWECAGRLCRAAAERSDWVPVRNAAYVRAFARTRGRGSGSAADELSVRQTRGLAANDGARSAASQNGHDARSSSLMLYPLSRNAEVLPVSIGAVDFLTRSHPGVGYFRMLRSEAAVRAIQDSMGIPVAVGLSADRALAALREGRENDLYDELASCVERFRFEHKLDFVLVEGAYFAGHSERFCAEFCTSFARMLAAPIIGVLDVAAALGQLSDNPRNAAMAIAQFTADHVGELRHARGRVLGTIVVRAPRVAAVKKELAALALREREQRGEAAEHFLGVMPLDGTLESAEVRDLQLCLHAEVLAGERWLERQVRPNSIVIGTMALEDLLAFLQRRSPLHKLFSAATLDAAKAALEHATASLEDSVTFGSSEKDAAVAFKQSASLQTQQRARAAWNLDDFQAFLAANPARFTAAAEPESSNKNGMQEEQARRLFRELDEDGDGLVDARDLECAGDAFVVLCAVDRIDLVLGLLAVDHSAEWRSRVAAVVLTAETAASTRKFEDTRRLLAGLDESTVSLPVLGVRSMDTLSAARILMDFACPQDSSSARKVERCKLLFHKHIDTVALASELGAEQPLALSSRMFEHQLVELARREPLQRIVLPEGAEPNMILAAAEVLRKQLAEITLLGDEQLIIANAARLRADISRAHILDPAHSRAHQQLKASSMYEASFEDLRALDASSSGDSVAATALLDPSTLGTLMVKSGAVDGMVAGLLSTTFTTVRPALALIGLEAGCKILSSVFFMLLEREVLVFADCALNPDPTAAQLAEIALGSARLAAQFGLSPRVAMISYSTGASGTGPDVEKVAQATALAREAFPRLPLYGPIQVDAALDPRVAKTKVNRDDDVMGVAGRANVLVFPNLSAANNAYKAVSLSSGAGAIGPVMHGLAKPVNDVSRGAIVSEIVDTILATCCQARFAKQANALSPGIAELFEARGA